jgi:hypothetical protein
MLYIYIYTLDEAEYDTILYMEIIIRSREFSNHLSIPYNVPRTPRLAARKKKKLISTEKWSHENVHYYI